MTRYPQRWSAALLFSIILSACGAQDPATDSASMTEQGIKPGGSAPSAYVPMAITSEVLKKRWSETDPSCFAVDDQYDWTVAGSLLPGESFTFHAVPTCDFAEMPMIAVKATWDASDIEVSSTIPANDDISGDAGQEGTPVVAATQGRESHLCMFTSAYGAGEGFGYSVTVRNKGTETAYDVRLQGQQRNGWFLFFHNQCVRADADHDGWNDSLEHGMQLLLYYTKVSDPSSKRAGLDGTNYLRTAAATSVADDEVDTYPPDVNDDGAVDQADVARVQSFEGQGTGVSMDMIDSNPGPDYLYNQTGAWRRYDLDGDGMVGSHDTDMVRALVGLPIPAESDVLAPTVQISNPTDGEQVTRGSTRVLEAFASDNRWIDRVDFYANGTLACSSRGGVTTWALTHQFNCRWSVPRKAGVYVLTAKAYDGSGNTAATTTSVLVQ